VGTEAPAPIRTFLIADVRGYTRFTEQHGDEVAALLAAKFADLVREGVETRGGSLVEVRGDEALAVFESARQAIRAAVDLQRVFVEETEGDPDYPLEVGIGIDSGEAVALDGGFRGAALNVAARLCALAHGGEIIASEGTTHLAGRLQGLRYIDRGRMHLKGVSEPVRGMNVAPEGEEPSSNRVFMFFNSPNRMGLKLGAVAAAIAAVTAGLVVYLVGENNPESSSATPPPPATSETPAGTPTSEEEVEAPDSLVALVPQQLWADCELQTVPEPDAIESAVCLPQSSEAPDRWEISLYPDGNTLRAAYEEEQASHDEITPDSGRCSGTFWGGEGPWLHGPDRPGGRRLCYLEEDDAVVVWTHERLEQPTHKDVLVIAREGGIDHAGLWRWFRPWHHEIGKVG
jgi:class 3 adenylate cyclase